MTDKWDELRHRAFECAYIHHALYAIERGVPREDALIELALALSKATATLAEGHAEFLKRNVGPSMFPRPPIRGGS